MLHLVKLLATHPFPTKEGGGGGGVLGAKETSSNVLQRSTTSLYPRFREYLTGSYTSPDFVTAGHTCAITTALHSPTSINKRLLAASMVEALSHSHPHSETVSDLSVGVSAGTHPPFGPTLTIIFPPPWTTTFNQAPAATFWSDTINNHLRKVATSSIASKQTNSPLCLVPSLMFGGMWTVIIFPRAWKPSRKALTPSIRAHEA